MITCPICKTTHNKSDLRRLDSNCLFLKLEGVNQHLIRYQCKKCGVIFGSEEMLNLEPSKLSKYYQDIYNSGYREDDWSDFELYVFLKSNPNKDGVYVNWGAGTSSTSEKAKDLGYTLYNYDPGLPSSSFASYLTREYMTQNMRGKIDVIMSNNVLDHLQDPISDLLFMKSLLKDGGKMLHASDGFAYEMCHTKAHLFFFVGKSVDFISDAIGMKHRFIDANRSGMKIVEWT